MLDPVTFREECGNIAKMGIDAREKIVISKKAHLILPTHKLMDAAQEAAAGKGKIGSTLKGIGPTYTDKVGRHGLRVGDILAPDFKERFTALKNRHLQEFAAMGFTCDPDKDEAEWMDAIDFLRSFRLVDCEYFLNEWLEDKPVLAEGAQGSLLDIDYGSYPFVTSSNTTIGGVCTGLGTGRPRRCGWLDLVALKYTVMVDGVTDLIMMKSDCLDDFETIRVCTSYRIGGQETQQFPFDTAAEIEPVYTDFKGWNTDLTGIRKEADLPKAFKDYIKFMEDYLGVPISIISLGPDREATIER